MEKTYKIILSVIAVLLVLTGIIEIHYQNYLHHEVTENSFVEVKEDLSINYLNGKYLQINNKTKTISFSITNHAQEDLTYYVLISELNGNTEDVTYTIESENEFLKQTTSLNFTSIMNNKTIKSNETHRYTMNIDNPKQHNFQFTLNVDLEKFDTTLASVIIKNNEVQEASLEHGFIHQQEDVGEVYYFKGNVFNNYLNFANRSWKIVKINEDRSVKLILNGITENLEAMNTPEMFGNTNFETSNLQLKLNNWYDTVLKDFDRYIISTTYCYDDTVLKEEDNKITYLPSYRLFSENIPTYSCQGSSISNKISLLTADEAFFAGARVNENKDYFLSLDNLQASWWTMTPSQKDAEGVSYISIGKNGNLEEFTLEKNNLFIRPVITINPRVNVTGLGTAQHPYQISLE